MWELKKEKGRSNVFLFIHLSPFSTHLFSRQDSKEIEACKDVTEKKGLCIAFFRNGCDEDPERTSCKAIILNAGDAAWLPLCDGGEVTATIMLNDVEEWAFGTRTLDMNGCQIDVVTSSGSYEEGECGVDGCLETVCSGAYSGDTCYIVILNEFAGGAELAVGADMPLIVGNFFDFQTGHQIFAFGNDAACNPCNCSPP